MGFGVNFSGTNVVMTGPEGLDDVMDIHAFRTEQCCVTCWQLDGQELEEFFRTGKLYLSVVMGGGMPPVFIGTEKTTRELVANYGPTFPAQDGAVV